MSYSFTHRNANHRMRVNMLFLLTCLHHGRSLNRIGAKELVGHSSRKQPESSVAEAVTVYISTTIMLVCIFPFFRHCFKPLFRIMADTLLDSTLILPALYSGSFLRRDLHAQNSLATAWDVARCSHSRKRSGGR